MFLGTDCHEEDSQDEQTDLARWKSAKVKRLNTKSKSSGGSSDHDLEFDVSRRSWCFSISMAENCKMEETIELRFLLRKMQIDSWVTSGGFLAFVNIFIQRNR